MDLAKYCVDAVLVEGRSMRAVAAATGRSDRIVPNVWLILVQPRSARDAADSSCGMPLTQADDKVSGGFMPMKAQRGLRLLWPVLALGVVVGVTVGASVTVAGAAAPATTAAAARSPIQHVIVILQENHSFDNALGKLCAEVKSGQITRPGRTRVATERPPERPRPAKWSPSRRRPTTSPRWTTPSWASSETSTAGRWTVLTARPNARRSATATASMTR